MESFTFTILWEDHPDICKVSDHPFVEYCRLFYLRSIQCFSTGQTSKDT